MTAMTVIDLGTATPLDGGPVATPCADWRPGPWAPARSAPWRLEGASGFSREEWIVIVMAGRDTLASVRAPGRLGRVVDLVFGLRRPARLADPRLEALRTLAVQVWHCGLAVPRTAVCAAFEAGYAREQVDELVARVAGELCSRRRPARRMARTGGCRGIETLRLVA